MEKTTIEKLLDEKVVEELEKLGHENVTNEEKGKIIMRIGNLSRVRNERVKVDSDAEELIAKRKDEQSIQAQKVKSEKLEFWSKIGLAGLQVIGPIVGYGFMMVQVLEFEKTGTITSAVLSKGVLNRFK